MEIVINEAEQINDYPNLIIFTDTLTYAFYKEAFGNYKPKQNTRNWETL